MARVKKADSRKKGNSLTMVKTEISIMKNFSKNKHKNIIQVAGVVEESDEDHPDCVCIIMEAGHTRAHPKPRPSADPPCFASVVSSLKDALYGT